MGDFWSHANDQFWEKSGGAPATVWPREYLKKRMRLVNSLWKVADTNLGMEFSIPGLHNSFEYTVLEWSLGDFTKMEGTQMEMLICTPPCGCQGGQSFLVGVKGR